MDEPDAGPARTDFLGRGLVMLVFIVLFGFGQWLLNLLAIAQFLWLAFSNKANPLLVKFGRSLAKWLGDVARFQCCDTEERPFPWAAWPSSV